MQDHTVDIVSDGTGTSLVFADKFNMAVPLVDRHLAEGRGGKAAILTDEGETVTYAVLATSVNRCGNALRGLGVAPGDRVLMMVKDCPAFAYAFLGAIKAGIVPVPLNTMLRAADYQYMIEDSAAAAVIYSPEFAAEVEPALAAAGHKPAHTMLTEGDGETLASIMAKASDSLDPMPAAPTDDCFWLYSSGSTGRPKGAIHAQRDIAVTCHHYAVEAIGLGEGDISFSAAKLFFAYGLGNALTFPLWTGGTAVLSAARPSPDMTFGIIERFRPTYYYGVPTLYAAQLKALESAKPDLSSLTVCVSAGEALPPTIFQHWQDRTGIPIYDGIGTTEMLHIFITSMDGACKPGFTGKVCPGYKARIVGEDGKEVGTDAPGFLHVWGLSAAKSYWNQPEKTAETMLGGDWLKTGDIYVRDADGFYRCDGRSDDMLKVGGIWCSPVEIEQKLVEHPAVLEAAVVGRADENDLIKPEAYIVLSDSTRDSAGLERDLLDHCKTGLAPYKYPRWINFVDELPKTATGKIQRFRLREE